MGIKREFLVIKAKKMFDFSGYRFKRVLFEILGNEEDVIFYFCPFIYFIYED